MKLKLREHKEFREIFRNLGKNNIEDITFNLDRNKLCIKETDRTMVSFFDINFKSSYFDEYELNVINNTFNKENNTPEILTISLIDFNNILKNIDKNAKIELNTVKNTLNIISETEYTTTQNLELLNFKKDELPIINNMQFKSSFIINSKNLIEIIKKFSNDNSLIFYTETDKINFKTEKDLITIYKGTDILTDLNPNNAKSKYSMEHLTKLIGFFKLFDKVKVSFSNDFPIKFNMSNDNISIDIILAPRIESE